MLDNSNFDKKPIFIGGMYKSGTSLLRAMLGLHPDVFSGLETYWFDLIWNNLESQKTRDRLNWIKDFYSTDDDVFRLIIESSNSSESFLDQFMTYHATLHGKTRWLEKTPGNICYSERIFSHWPDAKIIHIIRDPRDIFSSLKIAKKWDTIEDFFDRWAYIFHETKKIHNSYKYNSSSYKEIRYEDLILKTKSTLTDICDYIEVDFKDSLSEFSGQSTDFEIVKKVTGKQSTTLSSLSKPIGNEKIGIWRNILNDRDLSAMKDKAIALDLADYFEKYQY